MARGVTAAWQQMGARGWGAVVWNHWAEFGVPPSPRVTTLQMGCPEGREAGLC